MNIVLLVPPTSLAESYGGLKDFSHPVPSLGLAYMAAVLKEAGYSVSVLDAYVLQLHIEPLIAELKARKADIVGISVLTTSADVTVQIIKRIRVDLPQAKIVLGNIHASIYSDDFLEKGLADFVVHREGEYTILELVRALEQGKPPSKVPGVSCRVNGRVVHAPPRPPIEDLDRLPYPAWDQFPMHLYKNDPRTTIIPGAPEAQLLATRGCPNACSFCSSRDERSQGSRYRMRSPKAVVDEIQHLREISGIRVFSFMDLAFPLNKRHAMEIAAEIVRRGLDREIKWFSECRVKPLDLETLQALKASGCARLNFGIESGSNDILKLLRKAFTTEDVERAVELTAQAGIEADGMFMIGLPTETEAHIRRTVELAIRLDLRYAIFNIFVPYPGCDLYNHLNKEGKINFRSWSDFTSYPTFTGGQPVYVPDALSHHRLTELQQWAMRKFYLRPRFILGELRRFDTANLRHYWNGLTGFLLRPQSSR